MTSQRETDAERLRRLDAIFTESWRPDVAPDDQAATVPEKTPEQRNQLLDEIFVNTWSDNFPSREAQPPRQVVAPDRQSTLGTQVAEDIHAALAPITPGGGPVTTPQTPPPSGRDALDATVGFLASAVARAGNLPGDIVEAVTGKPGLVPDIPVTDSPELDEILRRASIGLESFSEAFGPAVAQGIPVVGTQAQLAGFGETKPESQEIQRQILTGEIGISEGLTALQEQFRQRPVGEQLALGMVDPLAAIPPAGVGRLGIGAFQRAAQGARAAGQTTQGAQAAGRSSILQRLLERFISPDPVPETSLVKASNIESPIDFLNVPSDRILSQYSPYVRGQYTDIPTPSRPIALGSGDQVQDLLDQIPEKQISPRLSQAELASQSYATNMQRLKDAETFARGPNAKLAQAQLRRDESAEALSILEARVKDARATWFKPEGATPAQRAPGLTPDEITELDRLKGRLALDEAALADPRPYSATVAGELSRPGSPGYRPPPARTEAQRVNDIADANDTVKFAREEVTAAQARESHPFGPLDSEDLTSAKSALIDARAELRQAKKPAGHTTKEKAYIAAADKLDTEYPKGLRTNIQRVKGEIAELEARQAAQVTARVPGQTPDLPPEELLRWYQADEILETAEADLALARGAFRRDVALLSDAETAARGKQAALALRHYDLQSGRQPPGLLPEGEIQSTSFTPISPKGPGLDLDDLPSAKLLSEEEQLAARAEKIQREARVFGIRDFPPAKIVPRQSVRTDAPLDMSSVQSPSRGSPGPGGEIPLTQPRTIADLNREAKGMWAYSPEQRAAIMNAADPVNQSDLLFQVEDYDAPAKRLLGQQGRIAKWIEGKPFLRAIASKESPTRVRRNNPAVMIGAEQMIFKETQKARARFATLGWWKRAEDILGFNKDPITIRLKRFAGSTHPLKAMNVQASPSADPSSPVFRTIFDIVERPEHYKLTDEQAGVIKEIQDVMTQLFRDEQRAGVNAVELDTSYWPRVIRGGPKKKNALQKLIARKHATGTTRKGHTKDRSLEFAEDTIKAGYEVEMDPVQAIVHRLESGIDLIAEKRTLDRIARLPEVQRPITRVKKTTAEPALEARQARDLAKATYKATETPENFLSLRLAEADYMTARREFLIKSKQEKSANFQSAFLGGDQEGYLLGNIAPQELIDDINKWVDIPKPGGSGPKSRIVEEAFSSLRSTMTTFDLGAGFIQGQSLFFRNNPVWWKAQGHAIISILKDPIGYVDKNRTVIDKGVRDGAIHLPTEFLFSRHGFTPTRLPIIGHTLRSFNRSFEWFITVGQTELYKAALSSGAGADELVEMGSAIRKIVGTESYAILGVRPSQQTFETMTFFAARFARANLGLIAQMSRGGKGGAEARKTIGALIAGGTALTQAIHYASTGKALNYTDPYSADWMQARVPFGRSYVNAFGPFYSYFRHTARMGYSAWTGDFNRMPTETRRFFTSKASIPFRLLRTLSDIWSRGESRTYEGEVIDLSLGGALNLLGEHAPIAPSDFVKGIQEGRPEAALGFAGGSVRGSPYDQMDILFQQDQGINPNGVSLRKAEPFQRDLLEEKYPKIAAKSDIGGGGSAGRARWKRVKIDEEKDKEIAALISSNLTGFKLVTRYHMIEAARFNLKRGIDIGEDVEYPAPSDAARKGLDEYFGKSEEAKVGGVFSSERLKNLRAKHLDNLWIVDRPTYEYVLRNINRRTPPARIFNEFSRWDKRMHLMSQQARKKFLAQGR